MKSKFTSILFKVMIALVAVVNSVAVMSAASASHINAYQPKVPAKLR